LHAFSTRIATSADRKQINAATAAILKAGWDGSAETKNGQMNVSPHIAATEHASVQRDIAAMALIRRFPRCAAADPALLPGQQAPERA